MTTIPASMAHARSHTQTKPEYVRDLRLFCATAILAASILQIAFNINELAAIGISAAIGGIAVVAAKGLSHLTHGVESG